MTERLRKFFRIRGKTAFALDEIVAPVVLVQDLTQGPYQAGVTPAAGTIFFTVIQAGGTGVALVLNDKAGSLTPILDSQFDNRSFSVTNIDLQIFDDNVLAVVAMRDILISVHSRIAVASAGVPDVSASLFSIQNNDGSLAIPVELFAFEAGLGPGSGILRTALGDNINAAGAQRTIEPVPQVTIGKSDALVMSFQASAVTDQQIFVSIRGYYQSNPPSVRAARTHPRDQESC